MNELEILQVSDDKGSLRLRVSLKEATCYFTLKELCDFFNRDRLVVAKRLKHIVLQGTDTSEYVVKTPSFSSSGKPITATYYTLLSALELGKALGSKRAEKLKEFLDLYLESVSSSSPSPALEYHDGDLSLSVPFSQEEKTVYLSASQIARLFEISISATLSHIKAIVEQGELGNNAIKKQTFGKGYFLYLYSLDVILCIGYRVKTKKAMTFRNWAGEVLRQYVTEGYTLNEKTLANSSEAFSALAKKLSSLEQHNAALETRLASLEQTKEEPIPKEAVFYEGDYFDGRAFFIEIFAKAKRSIFIVDPFADVKLLSLLRNKKIGVSLTIVTAPNCPLHAHDRKAFLAQYDNSSIKYSLAFHDRFVVIDDKDVYHMGASFNGIGKRAFAVMKMSDKEAIAELIKRIKAA